ncbi:MAG: FliA/WhiG family RNA polymerase sigma factor [Clostridia bacterium]|nr:FliA/WhiG family RNA polymerase sigma factor [Clostridia bacterium]
MNNSREEKWKNAYKAFAADPGALQKAPLPAEADAQAEALWAAFQKSRTTENKNRLVVHYVPLVNRIVSRIVPMYTAGTSYEDLVGYGVLGLIDAVDKYAPERNVKFETYAVKRIKGEIIDSMRRQDWAPASLRSRIKQIDKAYEQMEASGLEATDEDVAEYLGLDVRQVRAASEKAYMFNVLHFETLISSTVDGGDTYLDAMPGGDASAHPDKALEKQELKKSIANIINDLPEKEKQIITLYYYEELMLKDIAALLRVTPARVSQIHARALEKIKKGIRGYLEPTK